MTLFWTIDDASKKPLHGFTILVVDDDLDVLRVLVRCLVRSGARVRQASSGRDAIAASLDERVDVLLTDVEMPDLEGPAVARAVGLARRGVTTIYMSGASLATHVARGHIGPHEPFLRKPFAPAELVETLVAFLRIESERHEADPTTAT